MCSVQDLLAGRQAVQKKVFGSATILKPEDAIYARSPCVVWHCTSAQLMHCLVNTTSGLATSSVGSLVQYHKLCNTLKDSREDIAVHTFEIMQNAPLFRVFSAAALNSLVHLAEERILFPGDVIDDIHSGVVLLVGGKATPVCPITGGNIFFL